MLNELKKRWYEVFGKDKVIVKLSWEGGYSVMLDATPQRLVDKFGEINKKTRGKDIKIEYFSDDRECYGNA